MEEITKEQYDELNSKCVPITSVAGVCNHEEDEKFIAEGECPGGACPMR